MGRRPGRAAWRRGRRRRLTRSAPSGRIWPSAAPAPAPPHITHGERASQQASEGKWREGEERGSGDSRMSEDHALLDVQKTGPSAREGGGGERERARRAGCQTCATARGAACGRAARASRAASTHESAAAAQPRALPPPPSISASRRARLQAARLAPNHARSTQQDQVCQVSAGTYYRSERLGPGRRWIW